MTGYQSKKAMAQDKLDSMEREALKMALEALELLSQQPTDLALDYADNAINALRERLAQPAQEPVGFVDSKLNPIQRPWVGLTDAEKDGKRVLKNGLLFNAAEVQAWELGVEYAESILKDKNNA